MSFYSKAPSFVRSRGSSHQSETATSFASYNGFVNCDPRAFLVQNLGVGGTSPIGLGPAAVIAPRFSFYLAAKTVPLHRTAFALAHLSPLLLQCTVASESFQHNFAGDNGQKCGRRLKFREKLTVYVINNWKKKERIKVKLSLQTLYKYFIKEL